MSKRTHRGSDICYCEDYRSQHSESGKCRVCRGTYFDLCESFSFSRKANKEEQLHWEKHHGKRRLQP